MLIIDAPVRWWKCPSCDKTDRTQRAGRCTLNFHECAALGGAAIPLAEVPTLDDKPRARQVIVPSEHGHEAASVRTERLDGSNDVTVFPPTAVATGHITT